MGRGFRLTALAVLVVAGALLATACEPGTLFPAAGPDTAEARVPEGTLDHAGAVAALAAIPVAPQGSGDGYDRDCGPGEGCVFGPSWSDDVDVAGGRNGCDTRNDVLARDLGDGDVGGTLVVERLEDNNCVVLEGVLDDPFTGARLHFRKRTAGDLQVDHVVPLAAAWRAGAAAWEPRQRQNFANDPRNLLLVDGGQNQSKGDATIDEWQPPNAAFHCEYARMIVTVKSAYALTVTAQEQATLRATLDRCVPSAPAPPAPTP